jgi:RAP domain/FAST kinase-like protein, subdomain 2
MFFGIEGIFQLHQFQLWCKEQNMENWLPPKLQLQCLESFVSADVKPSFLQNNVIESLRTLQGGVSLIEEEVSTQSGYSLDAVVVFQGIQIGVEVDGPFHFVGRSQSPNGATLLKHRQLCALEGWKLASIPYWEWNELDKGSNGENREKKELYLQKLLEETLAVSR